MVTAFAILAMFLFKTTPALLHHLRPSEHKVLFHSDSENGLEKRAVAMLSSANSPTCSFCLSEEIYPARVDGNLSPTNIYGRGTKSWK